MTAAERHREDCFRRRADEYEQVRCHWHPDPLEADDCRGRLQACHIVSANRLKWLHDQATWRAESGMPHNELLAAVDLDDLLADGRNGVPGAELCHGRNEGAVLHCEPPEDFYEFLADFGLEYVYENARTAA